MFISIVKFELTPELVLDCINDLPASKLNIKSLLNTLPKLLSLDDVESKIKEMQILNNKKLAEKIEGRIIDRVTELIRKFEDKGTLGLF